MKNLSPKLFLEINNSNLIFFVIEDDYQNAFKISYKLTTPLTGLLDNRITDLEKIFNFVKENIYTIEKKVNFTLQVRLGRR